MIKSVAQRIAEAPIEVHEPKTTVSTSSEAWKELKPLPPALPEVPPRPTDKHYLLVLGGSQGAHAINMAMMDAIDQLAVFKDTLHITHQTGQKDYEQVKSFYADNGFSADVRPFIDDIEEQYRKASLVICHSGVTTLAEITACGKVSILIPFPHAAHNHQEFNARIIEAANAGELILEQEISGERLASSIQKAIETPELLKEREDNSYQLGNREATEKVRQICMQLMHEAAGENRGHGKSNGKYVLSCF